MFANYYIVLTKNIKSVFTEYYILLTKNIKLKLLNIKIL
jgi:hypothetical protein